MSSFFKSTSMATNSSNGVSQTSAQPTISTSKTMEEEGTNTPHYHFIHSMLLPSTVKIQKELRGRRFKEVQAKLGEAVMGLHQFQFEDWQPSLTQIAHTSSSEATCTNTTVGMNEKDSQPSEAKELQKSLSLDDHFRKQSEIDKDSSKEIDSADPTEDEKDGEESVMGDFSKAPHQEEDLRPFDDISVTTATTSTTAATNASLANTATNSNANIIGNSERSLGSYDDDLYTKIPVHKSIQDAVEAYIMVMEHPQKTNKACEDALSCVMQLVVREYVSGRAGGKDDKSGSGSTSRENTTENEADAPPSLVHRIMVGVQKCSESSTDTVQNKVIETFKEVLTCKLCSVHEASMLLAVRSIFHIYLVTNSKSVKESAKEALVDMVSNVVLRMEAIQAKQGISNSLFHTDSFYLLRSLIKLSSKVLPGLDDKSTTTTNFLAQQFFTAKPVDPLALNNKVLSLELILIMMECAGDGVCNGERFVRLVQSQLCVALLKNCMSNNSKVSFISQRIFLVLVSKFKAHLREEIQLFMSNMFFRVIDSENASFAQKALVLESLRSLGNDPQLLAQIFLNYDCDFDSLNLYKDIIFHLTKLCAKMNATSTSNMIKKDAEEHTELSLATVEVLVTILGAFLKALGIEVTDVEINNVAGRNIREMLQIQDVGSNSISALLKMKIFGNAPSITVATPAKSVAEGEVSVEDLQQLQEEDQSTNLPHVESSAEVADRIVDAFDRKRNAEQNFELGSVKFTLNLKTGLNFFFENGFCSLDAKEIALFFLANKDKLDKTQMGEVLGREPDSAFVKKGNIDAENGGPGFYVRILHHYVEAQEYTGLMFDDAIRLFLSGFRLPGEAQKIDRIMEKFAERFTRQNPDVFPNADTAFILAFSVIMLNTDLHNPSIKPEKRMTVDGFIRNNRGIGENGADLPEDFLRGIFKRIQKSPFSLKEDDAAREKAAADSMQDSFFVGEGGLLGFGLVGPPTTAERKKKQFKKEREEIISATEELVRRRKQRAPGNNGRSVASSVAPADVVKPMFDVTWGPVVGIFSQVIEMATDERSIAVCFNGFVYAIRLSSHGEMSLARETFINSLMKFTLLGSLKEMKYKNMVAIQTLMKIAATDGEYLGESWGPVLQCISQLAKMRTAASGLRSDESFLEDAATRKTVKTPQKTTYFGAQTAAAKAEDTAKETEQSNQRAVLEAVSEQIIDQIFSSTVRLSAHSLADFIRQLVLVCTAEIAGTTTKNITGMAASSSTNSLHGEGGPSIFSLQRLVEVADYNMAVRPRLVWAQLWDILGDFFAKAGCNRNSMVSVFAIDSLKQLSSKFLEQPELSEFHFQRTFLRPFLLILENPQTRQDIKELILECISQIVDRKAHNLQSGWKIFFDIVMISARDDNAKITLRALNILQKMLDEHLDKLTRLSKVNPDVTKQSEMSSVEKRNRDSNAEDFIGMCRTSLSFIQTQNGDSPIPLGVSMRALCHLAIYADIVADGQILPPATCYQTTDKMGSGYTYEGLDVEESLEMTLWRPILEGLASGIASASRDRVDGVGCMVQRGSVLAIRAILLRHGSLFSVNQLEAILSQTLVPTFVQAAESDHTPIVKITSESPAITGLDFLSDALPLPPPRYDHGLLKFEEVARSVECAPSRPLGPAELLLEACMTDMRHGGDGDLTQAYKFARKDMPKNSDGEQPFPDSWIATTGPLALGCLTDIASEIILIHHGKEGAMRLWPCIGQIYQRWANGEIEIKNERNMPGAWTPCEALVRISTREIIRFSSRLVERLSTMEPLVAEIWVDLFVTYLIGTFVQSLDIEQALKKELLHQKLKAYKQSRLAQGSDISDDSSFDQDSSAGGSNASLPLSPHRNAHAWVRLVPVLKIRCIAAYFLQQAIEPLQQKIFLSFLTKDLAESLLEALECSRRMADQAVRDEDLAHAFQEAMLSEWGDDNEEMGEEALVNIARLAQTQGSSMFFLTQTAGATQSSVWLLRGLFQCSMIAPPAKNDEVSHENMWDRESFAAPYLLDILQDVLTKFLESEAKEGTRIDPNVWRNVNESGVKVAVYCTSFASVVVSLLHTVLYSFEDERHMKVYGPEFFPTLCQLITVQSEEIRRLVQQILIEKFGPILAAPRMVSEVNHIQNRDDTGISNANLNETLKVDAENDLDNVAVFVPPDEVSELSAGPMQEVENTIRAPQSTEVVVESGAVQTSEKVLFDALPGEDTTVHLENGSETMAETATATALTNVNTDGNKEDVDSNSDKDDSSESDDIEDSSSGEERED